MAGGSPKKRPAIVAEMLDGPLENVPDDRPEPYRSKLLSDLKTTLNNQIITWSGFQGPKKLLEEQLRRIAAEIRWRSVEAQQTDQGQESCPNIASGVAAVPAPQGPGPVPPLGRMVPQAQMGNNHGARQLRQIQGVQKQPLPLHSVNTRMAVENSARTKQHVAAAHGRGEQQSRQCVSCSKQVQGDAATDADGIVTCLPCFQKQANALDLAQESHKGSMVNKLRTKTAAARGAVTEPSGSGAPRASSSGALHRSGAAGGSSGGLDQRLPAPKKGQQPQQKLSGQKRPTSDSGDVELPPKRDSAAARTRGRRSAPDALEDKEPIVLVDSSDDEGAACTDAAQDVKNGAEGDPGGKATSDKCGSFLKLSARLAGLKCCFPVDGGKDSVEVAAEDLARLENGEFLNDTCIDFYIKYIEAHLPEDVRARYHFFNSFFLKKLQEKPGKMGKLPKAERVKQDHERVKKWTKHVDLFSKDFIFVPIHGHLHWSLVLICHPGNVVHHDERLRPPAGAAAAHGPGAGTPLMLHLDSLAGNHAPKAIFEGLRSYLELEWKRKMDDETAESVPRRWKERFLEAGVQAPDVRFTAHTLPGVSMSARLPKQDNHTDCGLFLLSYMDFFAAANPRCVVSEGSNAQDVHALDPCSKAAKTETLLQKGWFRRCNAARLRDHLRALICRLMLDCVPQEDQRRSTLVCVVNDYDNKPHKMGLRYLDPEGYLRFVRECPDEDRSITYGDVLSSGSDAEEPIGVTKNVLQSPSPLTTRAAAKKAGTRPDEALPMHTPAGRKRDKAQEPAVGGVGAASESNHCAVGSPSPGKVVPTSRVDIAAGPAVQGSTEDEGAEEEVKRRRRRRRATGRKHGQGDTCNAGLAWKEATAKDVTCSPVTPPSQQDPETLPVRRPLPGVEQSSDLHASEQAMKEEAVGISAGQGQNPKPLAGKRCRKVEAGGAPGDKAGSSVEADVTERVAKPGKAAAAEQKDLQKHFQTDKPATVSCDVAPDYAADHTRNSRSGGQCRPSSHGAQVASQLVAPPPDGLIPGDHFDSNGDPSWLRERRVNQYVHDSPSSGDEQCVSPPQLGGSARVLSQQTAAIGLSNENGTHGMAHVAYRRHTRFPDDDAEPTTELVPVSAHKAGRSPSHYNGDQQQQTYLEQEAYSTGSSYGSGSRPKRRRRDSVRLQLVHTENAAGRAPVVDSAQGGAYMDVPFNEKVSAAAAARSGACADANIAAIDAVLLRGPRMAMSGAADFAQEFGQRAYGQGSATSRSVSAEPEGPPEQHTERKALTAKRRPVVSTSRFLAALEEVGCVAPVGAAGRRSDAVSSAPVETVASAAQPVVASPNILNAVKEHDERMNVDISFNQGYPRPQNDSPASMQAEQQPTLQGVQPTDLGSLEGGVRGGRLQVAESPYSQSGHGHDQYRRQSTQAPSAAQMQQSSPAVLWLGPSAISQPSGRSAQHGPVSFSRGDMKRSNKIRETRERLEYDLRQLNGSGHRCIPGHPRILRDGTAVPEGGGDALRKPIANPGTGGSGPQLQGALDAGEGSPSDGWLPSTAAGDGGSFGVEHRKPHRMDHCSSEQHPTQDASRPRQRASPQPLPGTVGSTPDGVTASASAANAGPDSDQPPSHQSPSLRLELQDGGGSQEQAEQGRVSEEGLLVSDDEAVPRFSGGGGIAGASTEQVPVPRTTEAAANGTSTERSGGNSPDLLTPASACDSDIMPLMPMFWKAAVEGHIVGKRWLEIGASRQVPATEGMPSGTARASAALAAADPSSAGGLRNEPSGGDESSAEPDVDEAMEIAMHEQLDGEELSNSGKVSGLQWMAAPSTAGTARWSEDGTQAAGIEQRSSNLHGSIGAGCTRQQEVAGSSRARQLGIHMGEGPSHAEVPAAVEEVPGSAAREVSNAAAAAPDGEHENADLRMAPHGRAAASPAAVSSDGAFWRAGSGGEQDAIIINVDDESDEQLAEGAHEMECGGDGSAATAPPRAQGSRKRSVGPSRSDRGTENEGEALDDSSEEDSLDAEGAPGADGSDEHEEDSNDAFVPNGGPGTGQSRREKTMTPSACGKQAKQKQCRSRGSNRKGPGRGKGRRGGHSGNKPCSSTKGVTPSRGGGAGGSTCGRGGKQGKRRNWNSGQGGGGIDAYCKRQGAEMVRTKVKPDFPRRSRSLDAVSTLEAKQAQHDPYDLTLDDD
ncbi:hypothetical protein Vafri_16462 [Volvox africanus]|uniref:Ubiquitin-like protease family profile domain-containing protein n=1 Tax=Volvox africanus TaxID=51714 RepID=A0A8J4BIE8_9CHLO|nr:hypothetical protein Vafri_16462 [Volvox africanus]